MSGVIRVTLGKARGPGAVKDAAMNQPAKAQEPSMEEILASIRRIIADDDAAKPAKPEPAKPAAAAPPPKRAPKPAPPEPAAMSQDDIDAMLSNFDQPPPAPPPPPTAPPAPEPEADVLDLTEAMATPEPEPPPFRTIGTEPDVMFAEPAPDPEPPLPPRPAPVAVPPPDRIVSDVTRAAVDAAFNSLAQTVLVQNARTLEDLVKEMLRPMLKSWLDDNLPTLVERLVRAEIERVSRGSR
jgi:cell pole-organizing protein PopZ